MSNVNMTEVRLLNVPLENDYQHTLFFSGKSSQSEYFLSKVKHTFPAEFSYQRKDHLIRIPKHYDEIITCNYVMYKNAYYSDKWFYAFITDMKYINDGMTEVYIETDVIQTWLFDYVVKESFIEREHVLVDTIGLNTIPEGLETGEYICNSLKHDETLEDLCYVIQVTEWASGNDRPLAVDFGGIFSGGGAYICTTMTEVVAILNQFDENAQGEAVTSVYMVPKKFINNTSGTAQFSGQSKPIAYKFTLDKLKTIDDYTPRNKKLFTFPYCYLLMSNNNGTSNVLHFEKFKNADNSYKAMCELHIAGVGTVGGSIKCIPYYYNGVEYNQEEGIMCGKFPTLSWSSDLYTNWQTQNSLNIGMGVGIGALQIVGGGIVAGVTGGLGGAIGGSTIISGINQIKDTLMQVHQHSFTPATAKGNTNAGDINTCANMNTFVFYSMSIKKEYAQIIDKYFDMYGYKVNRVSVPLQNHRENYWYTKCINVAIDGDIPSADLQKIKDCYNRGITFWKNPANIQMYSVSNNIL